MPDWLHKFTDIQTRLTEQPDSSLFHYALRHGTMKLGLYAPQRIDPQTPHKQDELYIIAQGSGFFVKNGERASFKSQDIIFVEAGAEHRFEDFSEDFMCWVIFWGPEGGEG